MLKPRVIPALLLDGSNLIKTTNFQDPDYVGDPVNTIRIFNELEVDELMLLDVMATPENREPNFDLLNTLVDECFMPLVYGGGIQDVDTARQLFSMGFEKIVINSAAYENPCLIDELTDHFGSQSVISSIDVNTGYFGGRKLYSNGGDKKQSVNLKSWVREVEKRGVGEILITSIDREGTWQGFDVELVEDVVELVDVPVIAHGGAGEVEDIKTVIQEAGASAAAVGSMVVYQGKDLGILVNFPEVDDIRFAKLK